MKESHYQYLDIRFFRGPQGTVRELRVRHNITRRGKRMIWWSKPITQSFSEWRNERRGGL